MSVIKITNSNFESEVISSDKPVLIDFYADWCGPCRMAAPIVEKIAEEESGIKVGKINVDSESELARAFGIVSIPTLIVMRDGQIVNKAVGLHSREDILKMLK